MGNPPIFKNGKPSISMGHYTMAMLNNQRVTSNSILYVTVSSLDGSPGVQ